jgi:N-acetylneuraminic acid mutarotase
MVEAYDPVTNTWSTKASMPTARNGLRAEVLDGKLYAVGGHDGVSSLNVVEIYDPATNTWSTGDSMPTARYIFASGVINNGL